MDFQKVDFPLTAPGVCRSCGGASKEYYIDTGHSEEYYGAVYYCNECIAYIASLCGFLTPVVKDQLENRITELEAQLFDARVRLDAYSELEHAFEKLGIPLSGRSRFPNLPTFRPPGYRDDMDLPSPPGESEGREGAGEESSAPDGAVNEPGEHEGVAELRSAEQLDGSQGFVV